MRYAARFLSRRPRLRGALTAAALLLLTPWGLAEDRPSFRLAWSIYVGWAPWDYAEQTGILKKWADGDDPDMQVIAMEEKETVRQMFAEAVKEEKEWANFLFTEGSMIGLNERLLGQYVEWIANRRMKAIGLAPAFDIPAKNNPLPWTEHWLNSKGQQNAPQETEIESYVVGGIKQDVSAETFSGFKL